MKETVNKRYIIVYKGIDFAKPQSKNLFLFQVSRLAGKLASLGVTRGSRVLIYMPLVPEAIISMLATNRIGAIHSVVFGGSY